MTRQPETTWTELANRSNAGLEVTLFWSRSNGTDEIVVCVFDNRTGSYFEITADPRDALDVYYHPFARRLPDYQSNGATNKPDDHDPNATTAQQGQPRRRWWNSRSL
jgi:hypothetical protein